MTFTSTRVRLGPSNAPEKTCSRGRKASAPGGDRQHRLAAEQLALEVGVGVVLAGGVVLGGGLSVAGARRSSRRVKSWCKPCPSSLKSRKAQRVAVANPSSWRKDFSGGEGLAAGGVRAALAAPLAVEQVLEQACGRGGGGGLVVIPSPAGRRKACKTGVFPVSPQVHGRPQCRPNHCTYLFAAQGKGKSSLKSSPDCYHNLRKN
jgi:hypothetical protein